MLFVVSDVIILKYYLLDKHLQYRNREKETAMYKLDYTKAEILQISNDAFFYLRDGEEPLDEANLEEANEIYASFPNGFEIKGLWATIPDTDIIEATFVPYVIDDSDYDMYQELAKGYFWQLKFTQDNRFVKYWSYRESTGEREYKGEYELRISALSKQHWIGFSTGDVRKGKGCVFWLKHFTERKPGTIKIPKDLQIGIPGLQ